MARRIEGLRPDDNNQILLCLIRPLEWWDSLALCLVQCVHHHTPVANVDLSVWLLLPCQGMFHPILIVSFGD